jgi:hypothetical protein
MHARLRCPSPLRRNVGRFTCDRQPLDSICGTRKRERNTKVIVEPTTYVTETILPSFRPLTVAFSSHKASHSRTPHTRDLISDNPASSKNFPVLSLFPPHSPPTHPSIQVRAILRMLTWEPLVRLSRIPNSHFPPTLSHHLVFFRRSHKDRPSAFDYPGCQLLLYAAI